MKNLDPRYRDKDIHPARNNFLYHISEESFGASKKNPKPDFKSIIETITDGFFMLDNDWTITYWNNEIEKISGIPKESILGKSFWTFFPDHGNMKLFSECRIAKEENRSVRFEEYYEQGGYWVEVRAYPSETGMTVFFRNITGRKIAEASMKLSNERYDLVVKATNDLVWDWDIMKDEIYRNAAGVERVFGHSSNKGIKSNQLWLEHIHPDDRKRIDEQVGYYISSEGESSFSFEYRFRREDGGYNYINDRGYIIRNELGIVTRMIGAARDITATKNAALAKEASEQRYKLFVEQSTEGIWRIELKDPIPVDSPIDFMVESCFTNAYIAECNDAFAQMYGFEKASEIIGIPMQKLWPKEQQVSVDYITGFFKNNFKATEKISHEFNKSGQPVIFVNNMMGIVENNCLTRAWGIRKDITQQKKSEEQLLTSEEQYRNLFDKNPSCIFIWDPEDLRIAEANESAVETYGYSKEEFKQLTVLDIRPKDEHDNFLKLLALTKELDNYKKTRIWKHINKKGQVFFMEISSHKVVYNGKKMVLAIGNNVTEKIQLENSLNEERQLMHKQITDAVITGQERERLELGEELHDNINQILASTRLYIECALGDEAMRRDLLEKGSILLDSAMAEIRKLSKSLLPPSLGEQSLLHAIEELSTNMTLGNQSVIKKDWNGFDESIVCQKLKLTIFRIVQEQLNNIYKHAKAKNIRISLSTKENIVTLSVKDDGVGFNTSVKRSGIGLRNIASRAEVNNGTVKIKSAPGEGCELVVNFQVTL